MVDRSRYDGDVDELELEQTCVHWYRIQKGVVTEGCPCFGPYPHPLGQGGTDFRQMDWIENLNVVGERDGLFEKVQPKASDDSEAP